MTNRLLKNCRGSRLSSDIGTWARNLCFFLPIAFVSSCSFLGDLLPAREEIVYRVQSGDSLYLIARHFEVSMLELQSLNRVNDPRKLQVGQLLTIPSREKPSKEVYGGPYVSAQTARRERAKVILPDLKTIDIPMEMPVLGKKVGSPFGYRGTRFHEGIDIVAAHGTPIYAAHEGTVIFSGQRLSGYGKMIALKHGQILTVYAHNSENLVERGARVRKGDLIAKVGATGRASGPHLHFEVRVKASNSRYYAVEPFEFLNVE